MTTKTLIITPQGTAIEINKMGEKPKLKFLDEYGIRKKEEKQILEKETSEWQSIEDSLKEYKIAGVKYLGVKITLEEMKELYPVTIKNILSVDREFLCEVNEIDKTCIIL